jgi:pSer/pThr/pTyr-binding forkhead associated (FHA) protein
MISILILQHRRPDGEVDTYHLKAGRRYHLGRGSQCQVRILDLKLSRQHCAFENLDGQWMLLDLASTNGCTLDGIPVSGTVPIRIGSVVSAGSTSVTVAAIFSSNQEVPDLTSNPAAVSQLETEGGPPAASERLAAAALRASDHPGELEPHAQSQRSKISDPLILSASQPSSKRPVAPEGWPAQQVTPTPIPVDHDVLATMTPGVAEGSPEAGGLSPVGDEERTYFISVLGRRVGPLNRVQARELKARELKGTLTTADLAAIEVVAGIQGEAVEVGQTVSPVPDIPKSAPLPPGDEQATYYLTLLGRRVGPLTRTQARELKARELRGQLTEADLANCISP